MGRRGRLCTDTVQVRVRPAWWPSRGRQGRRRARAADDGDQLWEAISVLPEVALGPAARISMLRARIHAGNSNSAQGEMPMPTSSTSAVARPATVSHLDTIWVRRAMVTVVSVNTAAIRIE